MEFNEHQNRVWYNMITSIEDFRNGKISYTTLVYGLEGSLDAGWGKEEALVVEWYDYWTPLEILSATRGDNTTIEDADKYLLEMEMFLKSQSDFHFQ